MCVGRKVLEFISEKNIKRMGDTQPLTFKIRFFSETSIASWILPKTLPKGLFKLLLSSA